MPLLSSKISKFCVSLSVTLLISACASRSAMIDPSKVIKQPANTSVEGAQVVAPTGINRVLAIFSPYHISIQQGNFISDEMMSQVKQGMTREQIRFLLGTALLTDMFHEDRWDYPFSLKKSNGEIVTSRVSIFFKNNTVSRFEGGNLPTEKDYLAHISDTAITLKAESSILTTSDKKKEK